MKKNTLKTAPAALAVLALSAAMLLTGCGSSTPASSQAASAQSAASAPATETLTVEELSLHLADGSAQAVVTVEPADLAGQLTYQTGDDAIATVDETGVVTPVKEGHTSLLILAPDGTRGKTMITVWSGPKELTLTAEGEGDQLTVTAADETGAAVDAASLSWSTSDPNVATVDEAGVLTVVGEGEVTVSAQTYYEITGSVTLTFPMA